MLSGCEQEAAYHPLAGGQGTRTATSAIVPMCLPDPIPTINSMDPCADGIVIYDEEITAAQAPNNNPLTVSHYHQVGWDPAHSYLLNVGADICYTVTNGTGRRGQK